MLCALCDCFLVTFETNFGSFSILRELSGAIVAGYTQICSQLSNFRNSFSRQCTNTSSGPRTKPGINVYEVSIGICTRSLGGFIAILQKSTFHLMKSPFPLLAYSRIFLRSVCTSSPSTTPPTRYTLVLTNCTAAGRTD